MKRRWPRPMRRSITYISTVCNSAATLGRKRSQSRGTEVDRWKTSIDSPEVFHRSTSVPLDCLMDILILMGSDSDAAIMSAAGVALDDFGLTWEMTVASAHR